MQYSCSFSLAPCQWQGPLARTFFYFFILLLFFKSHNLTSLTIMLKFCSKPNDFLQIRHTSSLTMQFIHVFSMLCLIQVKFSIFRAVPHQGQGSGAKFYVYLKNRFCLYFEWKTYDLILSLFLFFFFRTGKTCTLTVRTQDEPDAVVEGFLAGPFSVFNLNHKLSKFFVGGVRDDVQVQFRVLE